MLARVFFSNFQIIVDSIFKLSNNIIHKKIKSNKMKKGCLECTRCKREISTGNAYVTLTKNIEQRELITDDYGEIQIIDSREIITLCGGCGNAFDWNRLDKTINEMPLLDSNYLKPAKRSLPPLHTVTRVTS
jgi:hypothetical protein